MIARFPNLSVGFPWQMIHKVSRSSLPIYEFDQATVTKIKAPIHPHQMLQETLFFNSWHLAHAILKADCAHYPRAQIQNKEILGFCLQYDRFFDWNVSGLRLNKGKSGYHADFSSSSLAGRIAQGMALLFLEEIGYSYVGHFKSEWRQRAKMQNKSWPKDKRTSPDFIVENKKGEWALAESKGSFSRQPKIKKVLKNGLHQLDGWDKYITPQPIKSFVIGTFIREHEHYSAGKTSSICFVDPEPESPQNPVKFPEDAIRRANYASWLSLMGFDAAAARLRSGDIGEIQLHQIPILRLDGNEYAVSMMSNNPIPPEPFSPIFLHGVRSSLSNWFGGKDRIRIIGIDLKVLRALDALRISSEASDLIGLKLRHRAMPLDWDGGKFYGSIYSDGSLLGELVHEDSIKLEKNLDWREIELWQHTEKN